VDCEFPRVYGRKVPGANFKSLSFNCLTSFAKSIPRGSEIIATRIDDADTFGLRGNFPDKHPGSSPLTSLVFQISLQYRVIMTDLGPYPYVPTFWDDGSGIFSRRMTLSTLRAAVASSLITLLLSVSLGSLASIVNTVIYIFFVHKRRKSILDDQTCVVASNAASPGSLLSSLLSLGYASRLKVGRSTAYKSYTVSTLSLLMVTGAAVYGIGKLFSDGPIPVTFGTCGFPKPAPSLGTLAMVLVLSCSMQL
jgi:hypothetical protein